MAIKRIHLLPNIITAFALSCGLFVIFKMNMTDVGNVTYHTVASVTAILLLAALADLLDGAVARAIKAESDFGGIFDSMADAISFGVAPSVIVLKSLSLAPGTEPSFFLTTAAMIFSVCGVLRLVRFNIESMQEKGDQELMNASKKNFTGLPIPGGAAAAVSANLFLMSEEFKSLMNISDSTRAWTLAGILVLLGYLMVCRLKFPSMKTLRVRVASFRLVFLTVLLAVVFSYGLLHHFAVVFFLFSWAYVIIALILSTIRLISGRKSKTLEDFEPEPDDLE
jgi:CDP-diacylglycerol--serine O-phosphatidyltransferase